MPLLSSETRSISPTPHDLDDGPVLECAPPPLSPSHRTDGADQLLGIRARRLYPVSREELFATWTRRTAWDSWMRLRARSRSTLAPYRGGAFRLELADGPTIHVIAGTFTELRPPESLSLTWFHQNANDHGSTLDITFRDHCEQSELTLLHGSISSRREAAWLMRLWAVVLGRFGAFLADGTPSPRRVRGIGHRMPPALEPEGRRSHAGSTFARSAGIAFALAMSTYTSAAAQAATDSAQAAASYFFAGKWNDAARAYGSLARNDTSAVTWYRYGVALDEIGRYDDAIVALRRAVRTGTPFTNQVRYRLAKAHAGRGARDSAIAELDSSAAGGFRQWEAVRDDADFGSVRGDPRFTRVLGRLETNRFPCRSTPENRQLDYWVGDWRVMSGTFLLGTNKVELVNGECMVQENWLAAGPGGGGKSWSYYDPSLKKWKQLFIFDAGGVWDFTGEMHDGAMRFERPIPATANAPAAIQRMTYFPIAKDSVRQLIENTTDGGKTWTPGFDGMYVRKPGSAR